jgi:hypothetical protein
MRWKSAGDLIERVPWLSLVQAGASGWAVNDSMVHPL